MPSDFEMRMAVNCNKATTSALMRTSSSSMFPAPVLQPRASSDYPHLRPGLYKSEQMWWYSPDAMREHVKQSSRTFDTSVSMSSFGTTFRSVRSLNSTTSSPTLGRMHHGLPGQAVMRHVPTSMSRDPLLQAQAMTTARAATATALAALKSGSWPLPPSTRGEYCENWQIAPTRSGMLMRTQSMNSLLG